MQPIGFESFNFDHLMCNFQNNLYAFTYTHTRICVCLIETGHELDGSCKGDDF